VRPPHALEWIDGIETDFVDLATVDPRLVGIARAIALDVANHHRHGKALGRRNISGDLSGFYRLSFDVPEQRVQRFRLIYDRPDDSTIRIVGLGEREGSAVYRALAQRLGN